MTSPETILWSLLLSTLIFLGGAHFGAWLLWQTLFQRGMVASAPTRNRKTRVS